MTSIAKASYTSSITVERYGLEAVPSELKTTKWVDYFILQVGFSVNSGNFLVPALAVLSGGLSFYAAVLSTVLGAAVAFIFVSLLTSPGSKNGIPAQYALRSMLGIFMARYIASPVRSLTSLYWFSVQTIGGTLVLIELAKKLVGIQIPFLPVAISLATLMSVLALVGFEVVKKVVKYFIPFLFIGQVVLFTLLIKEASSAGTTQLFHHDFKLSSFFFYASLAFVQYISGVSSSADMARYAKSVRGAFWGLYSGNTFGFIITASLGALSAALLGEWNPFVAVSSLTSSMFTLFLILLCSMVSMISINLNNAYTGGFSLLNILPSIGRVKSSIFFGITAITLSCFPTIVDQAKSYISLLGTLIIPISAVIVADFLFVKKLNLDERHMEDIIQNKYKWNQVGFTALCFGASIYSVLPDPLSPGFFSFIVTLGMYLALVRLSKFIK
ncbi:cytosine permease [Cytobacillus spongiae]|jgi:cytosine permease|uniref:purine-cytosine permease family protein n=1 Tax=Cytobacillus spongiae TaxID=2901381 RepID=UPI001F1A41E7|nr:cytosine permease [Cytobacillus spongiae]UII55171.1 cytosine permease [Cytobacillus spongiae]